MEIKEIIKKIEADQNYSLKGLIKIGVFENTIGFKSYQSCLKFILKDMLLKEKGILKTEMIGSKEHTIYIMSGKNIINFLKKYEQKNQKNCQD